MLHLIFQALIAEEQNKFNIKDSIDTISKKLVKRHPHVFKKEVDFNLKKTNVTNFKGNDLIYQKNQVFFITTIRKTITKQTI